MEIACMVRALCALMVFDIRAAAVTGLVQSGDMEAVVDAVYGITLLQVGRPLIFTSFAEQKGATLTNHTKVDRHIMSSAMNTATHGSPLDVEDLLHRDTWIPTWISSHMDLLATHSNTTSMVIASNVNGNASQNVTSEASGMSKESCHQFVIRLSLAFVVAMICVVAINAKRQIFNENFTNKVFKTEGDDDENDDAAYWVVPNCDLVSDMGLSGMCFLDLGHKGCTGYPVTFTLIILTIQGATLQVVFLCYLLNSLEPLGPDAEIAAPLAAMTLAAVYVHFVNVAQELIFDLSKVVHIYHMHTQSAHQLLVGVVVFVDCCVVPAFTLVIGSLFLCTSSSASELITNAVGVAFITEIDNFIVEINSMSNKMVRSSQDTCVHFPVDGGYVKAVNWLVCIVPVLPVTFTVGMYYSGKVHIGL